MEAIIVSVLTCRSPQPPALITGTSDPLLADKLGLPETHHFYGYAGMGESRGFTHA